MQPLEHVSDAYDLFVEAHSVYSRKDQTQIRAEITLEDFEARISQLYYQWLLGDFSFGRFTELIGIPHWELWEIFDALGLPRHK